MYEIVIGGWNNTKTVIRKGSQGSAKDERVTQSILSPNEDRPFWADAKNGFVRLGKGKIIGSDIVIKWQDNQPLDPVYVGFMTGFGSTGVWKISEDIKGKQASKKLHSPNAIFASEKSRINQNAQALTAAVAAVRCLTGPVEKSLLYSKYIYLLH